MKLKSLPDHCSNSGEPYRYYHLLSSMSDHQLILDIGTYRGFSAFAFGAANLTNKVHSFDVADYREIELPENVTFHNVGGLDIHPDLIKKADIILLDVDPHDGGQEKAIFEHIKKSGFSGKLICDDINLNAGMRSWFDSIEEDKEELSWHHSGTGIVYFK